MHAFPQYFPALDLTLAWNVDTCSEEMCEN